MKPVVLARVQSIEGLSVFLSENFSNKMEPYRNLQGNKTLYQEINVRNSTQA
jgi:hypothetical protein